jgi:hypothetical protein
MVTSRPAARPLSPRRQKRPGAQLPAKSRQFAPPVAFIRGLILLANPARQALACPLHLISHEFQKPKDTRRQHDRNQQNP